MYIYNKFLNIIANNILHKFYYKKNILSNFIHFIFKFRKIKFNKFIKYSFKLNILANRLSFNIILRILLFIDLFII